MKKGTDKLFIIIKYVHAKSVKDALRREKEGEVVTIGRPTREFKELVEASGVEINPPPWEDYENIPPETRTIGF